MIPTITILAILVPLCVIGAKTTTSTPMQSTSRPSTSRPSTSRPSTSRPSTTSRSSTSTTTTSPHWVDPSQGGRIGNPGALIRISNKTLDVVHSYVADQIAKSIQSIALPEFVVPIGPGVLTVKPPRVSEAKFANIDNDLEPPNRIRSRFYGGRIVATGAWQYKSTFGQFSPMNGAYQATIANADVNTTNQLGRGFDAKPTVQTTDCKSYLGQFKIDIQGGGNLTTIENCNEPICNKIRGFFEDAVCTIVRTVVKEVINRKLATFPARINVTSEKHQLDYGLLYNEPKVTDYSLQAGLEGKAIWRGSSYVPFSPNQLNFVENKRMASFELSDFSFNTLLHQAHSQGRGFSVAQSLSHNSSVQQQLRLNCSTSTLDARKRYRIKQKVVSGRSSICLGSIFENITSIVDHFPSNATGDLVYKSGSKAPSVFVQSAQLGFFDGSNGVLEVYGPAVGQNERQEERQEERQSTRQLLGRADIRTLRGEFTPKFNNKNITGNVKITSLQLEKASFGSVQSRSISDDWIIKLTQFATPILTEMFNTFFNRLAQFPIPLLDGFECTSPEFIVSARTMQVDCDIRAL